LEQANAALQCTLRAAKMETAWQACSSSLSLEEIFSLHEQRSVNLDNTISYRNQRFQLLPTEQPNGQLIPTRPTPADASQLWVHMHLNTHTNTKNTDTKDTENTNMNINTNTHTGVTGDQTIPGMVASPALTQNKQAHVPTLIPLFTPVIVQNLV
jgi:prophage tail gpP-like protein